AAACRVPRRADAGFLVREPRPRARPDAGVRRGHRAVGRDLDSRRSERDEPHHGPGARFLPCGDTAATRGRHGAHRHRRGGGRMDAAGAGVRWPAGARTPAGAVPVITEELVHLEITGGVGTITLDSPANRNALSRRLVADLHRQLMAALADPGVR